MKTKIKAKYIIGFANNDHLIYENGELIYEDDTILFVGHNSPILADQVIDMGEAIVSPGFIDLDALWDIDHAIYDAFVTPEQAKGLEWSEEYFNSGRKEIFSAEEERFRREYALVHLIKNGITTALPISGEYHKHWAETYAEFVPMAEMCQQYGLRAYLGPSYRSGVMVTDKNHQVNVLWDVEKGKQGLAEAVRFIQDFDGKYNGLVRGFLAPARIQSCTKELLLETARWGQELNVPVRLHACQEDNEVTLMRQWYGKTPLTWLHEIGFLAPNTMIPHATHLVGHHKSMMEGPSELPLLADTGASVVHCPVIEARYGVALDSFEKYRAAGVNLGLGTDTFPPDMIRVMDFGLNASKIMEGNQWSSKPADFFRAATTWGAKALGREDLGKLKAGAKADLIVIDLSQFETGTVDDPIRTLILNCTGHQVRTSIINGRVVMQDYQIPGVNLDEMRVKAQAYYDKMKAGYALRDYQKRTTEELFPVELPIRLPRR